MESPNKDCNMEASAEGDQASSGQPPTNPQGFEHRPEKENRNGNLPVNGAPDGDEMGPSKEKKMILDSSVDSQQVAPYNHRPNHPAESKRVPDSAVSASFKKQMSPKVPSEMRQGDQASSGPSPTDSQGFEHRPEKESSHGNHPVSGAPDGDEMGPRKEEKKDSSVDRQQVARYSGRPKHPGESSRLPDSDQVLVPASFQGFDHRTEKESSHRNLPVNGATDGDEMGPRKEKKKILDSSVDPQQVAPYSRRPNHPGKSHRLPDSHQVPVPASFKELMSMEVPSELHNAAETLGKYYHDRDNDPNIKKFFKTLVKALKESDSESSKTSSSHARTVKVHKIVTGKTFGAEEALLKQLNCKELQVEMTDRQGCDIIILFCPINSRVGSDVEFAMRQVSGEERVILILMHHTRDVDYSTAAKRWSETFGNVVFDINVLYHETVPGLLKCLRNTEAISDIRKELMQYSSSTNGNILTRHLPNLRFW